jgi:CDP-diacylglycerol--glycerol-3-phosphate 3-phosphatidyltransferase
MFGTRIQQQARRVAELVVRPLAAIGLTPNIATLLGLLLNGATAAVLATGHLRIGGALVLFAGVFDMFDGALARVRNQKTRFGAFFDSTLDRYSEGLVLLGVLLYAMAQRPSPARGWVVALTYVAALSSLMVSYTKARAEGMGLECKIGLMARPERVLLLAAGLILGGPGWLLWTMALLAVTSTFTAVQRITHVWRQLANRPVPARRSSLETGAPTASEDRPLSGLVRATLASRLRRSGALHVDTSDTFPSSARPVPTERSADH